MKNHFLDARTVFELFWINASVLSHSQSDLLSLSKGSEVQDSKIVHLFDVSCQFTPSQSYISLPTSDALRVINQFSAKRPMTRMRVMGTLGVFFKRSD